MRPNLGLEVRLRRGRVGAKILLKHIVIGLNEALPSRKIIICAQKVVVKIKYYEICFKLHRVVQILIINVISTTSQLSLFLLSILSISPSHDSL